MAMMDQQNFEATRPVSADPAVALARALGQLPKTPLKARGATKPSITDIVAKTSVEDLASELGLTLGDQNELTIRRIKRGKSYSFIRANGTPIRPWRWRERSGNCPKRRSRRAARPSPASPASSPRLRLKTWRASMA